MELDRVLTVRLRSYGFFHSGRERLRVRVVKRCWEFIPGSTLYGAVAAALLRLDGADLDEPVPLHGDGGYQQLLRAVAGGGVRFAPLLPDPGDPDPIVHTAQDYCRTAFELQTALYGDPLPENLRAETKTETVQSLRGLVQTTPHAPLNRHTLQVHESNLYATAVHRQRQTYTGFIFAGEALLALLRPALRYLPLLPFGGKGKFVCVEAEIGAIQNRDTFEETLVSYVRACGKTVETRLLTPLALQGGKKPLLMSAPEISLTRLRRYRAWRTGHYYAPGDPQAEDDFMPVGLDRKDKVPRGTESTPVLGIPERSCFRFPAEDAATCRDLARLFIEGDGNPAWTYLGWGQVVMA